MAEAAVNEKPEAAAPDARAGADGWLSPHHRCAQAQRPQDDLRRAGHSDHGLRPHGAGRRHPRHLVPSRAERRLRGVHRRLPDQEARHLPHRSAPGFLNGLTALAHATTNCFPMILISGSSERESRRPAAGRLRGDGSACDRQAAVQGGVPRAARADIGIGLARAIRAAVSGRPGGVYLDLPAKLFGQVMKPTPGKKSLVKVIDAAPRKFPRPTRSSARSTF